MEMERERERRREIKDKVHKTHAIFTDSIKPNPSLI